MLIKYKEAETIKKDDSFSIKDMSSDSSAPMDLVIGELDGFHGTYKNSKSVKYYLIIDGTASVKVDDDAYEVEKGDFVLIPKDSVHSIEGRVKFAIISTPPFDRAYEIKF
jgi:mannose-6-phosphate isomerase-like protein (cupin superfamily)